MINYKMQIKLVIMTCNNNSSIIALIMVMDYRAIYNAK